MEKINKAKVPPHQSKKNTTPYCLKCDDYVDFFIKEEIKSFIVRDIEVEVSIKRAYCKKCGERVTVKSIEKQNEIAVYDAYKEAKGLLTSEEIIAIRKRRNLTQRQFANLLKIGEKDIARYENGAIQNGSIDLLMRIAGSDFDFSCIPNKFSLN